MRYIVIVAFLLFIYGCANTRHSIGITTNLLSTKMEEKTKLNYKVIFGRIRKGEGSIDD